MNTLTIPAPPHLTSTNGRLPSFPTPNHSGFLIQLHIHKLQPIISPPSPNNTKEKLTNIMNARTYIPTQEQPQYVNATPSDELRSEVNKVR